MEDEEGDAVEVYECFDTLRAVKVKSRHGR